MKQLTIIIATVALISSGCSYEYKPRETFMLTTTDGRHIKLTCPVVESSRSAFTYVIDGHCVVEPSK